MQYNTEDQIIKDLAQKVCEDLNHKDPQVYQFSLLLIISIISIIIELVKLWLMWYKKDETELHNKCFNRDFNFFERIIIRRVIKKHLKRNHDNNDVLNALCKTLCGLNPQQLTTVVKHIEKN